LDEYIVAYEWELSLNPTKGFCRTVDGRRICTFTYYLDPIEKKEITVYYTFDDRTLYMLDLKLIPLRNE